MADLAAEGAAVEVSGMLVSDPRPVDSPYGEQVAVRLDVHEVLGRGLRHRLSVPVLVIGDIDWAGQPLGAHRAHHGPAGGGRRR